MGFTKGNSQANVGYSCLMPVLVSEWRALWSRTPGTTDPMAPFGVVTLAASGSEGGVLATQVKRKVASAIAHPAGTAGAASDAGTPAKNRAAATRPKEGRFISPVPMP